MAKALNDLAHVPKHTHAEKEKFNVKNRPHLEAISTRSAKTQSQDVRKIPGCPQNTHADKHLQRRSAT